MSFLRRNASRSRKDLPAHTHDECIEVRAILAANKEVTRFTCDSIGNGCYVLHNRSAKAWPKVWPKLVADKITDRDAGLGNILNKPQLRRAVAMVTSLVDWWLDNLWEDSNSSLQADVRSRAQQWWASAYQCLGLSATALLCRSLHRHFPLLGSKGNAVAQSAIHPSWLTTLNYKQDPESLVTYNLPIFRTTSARDFAGSASVQSLQDPQDLSEVDFATSWLTSRGVELPLQALRHPADLADMEKAAEELYLSSRTDDERDYELRFKSRAAEDYEDRDVEHPTIRSRDFCDRPLSQEEARSLIQPGDLVNLY